MQDEAGALQIYKDFTKGEGGLYGVSHALTQSLLAAGKTCRQDRRGPEQGIKCRLHGDLEILRLNWQEGADRNPRPSLDPFWQDFKSSYYSKTDFKASERLSAVALIKRLAHRVCQDMPDHPLKDLFQEAERFPSTTEIALTAWLDDVEARGLQGKFAEGTDWRHKLAQYLHDQEPEGEDREKNAEIVELDPNDRKIARAIIEAMKRVGRPVRDEDRYYAILIMDGDHMGKLVNGVTLGSTWKTVIHPDLLNRLENQGFQQEFHSFWQGWLDQRRLLSPGVHAAVSEALADFSLRTVPEIISRHVDSPQKGRLIYAGGDDVCAVLPVPAALDAAQDIARAYNHGFLFFSPEGGPPQPLEGNWQPKPGRLALHLGAGPEISISAAILIVHHKQPLASAMRRAQDLLKKGAKEQGGRNALAVELVKRSGGPRTFVTRWQAPPMSGLGLSAPLSLLEHFLALIQSLGAIEKEVSSSLLYRLEEFRPGLEALIHPGTGQPHKLVKLIQTLLARSGVKPQDQAAFGQMAEHLNALIARQQPQQQAPVIDTQPLAMAVFLSRCLKRKSASRRPIHE
jgi:CRISPR-associated protein Cmr2